MTGRRIRPELPRLRRTGWLRAAWRDYECAEDRMVAMW
jgi:hypothetical protein